jgi:alpha-aminoadipic semialdehyde synthase
VDVETLPQVAARGSLHKVYVCVVDKQDHLVRTNGGSFDEKEFFTHPERYKSVFTDKIAAYSSVIVNGIFWGPGHPRLITLPGAKRLLTPFVKTTPDTSGEPTLPHRCVQATSKDYITNVHAD